MKKQGTRLVALAVTVIFAHAIGAEENAAQRLFFEPSDGSKALFHSSGGSVVSAETGPGQDYSPENIGGLGGITDYYERLDNPGVMHSIELIQKGSNNIKQTTSRRVFRSGDRIRIHISTNSDGYLHATHQGTTGKSKMLPVTNGGRVTGGQDVVIPTGGGWLRFDEHKGIEQIDLLFSSHPTAAQEGLVPTGDPALPSRVQHSIELYGASKDLIVYDQEGELDLGSAKDLIVEGQPYAAVTPPPVVSRIRTGGASKPSPETLAAPASYAVNTGGKPVVVKIRLRHQ